MLLVMLLLLLVLMLLLLVLMLRSLILTALAARRATTDTDRTRPDATRRLDPKGRTGKRGWIDGRHPDSRLVDLEKVCDQGVEIDVRVGKVVERKLLPVP